MGISQIVIPHGFKAVSYNGLLKYQPALKPRLQQHLGLSETATRMRIQELEAQGRVQFVIAPNGDPGCFTAVDAGPLADLLVSFWDVTGKFDPERGEILSAAKQNPTVPEMLAATAQRLKVPHWQEAVDRKFQAMQTLRSLIVLEAQSPRPILGLDLNEDLAALGGADVYSFNAETTHAIMVGSKSIPCEAGLKSIELPPSKSGWFWFADPLPMAATPVSSDGSHALLWTWGELDGKPVIRFSVYVVDDKSADPKVRGTILPSTKWYWSVEHSFHEMLAVNTLLYRKTYGPGSPPSVAKEYSAGEEATMQVITNLSLFFLMSCLWFKQTVAGTKPKLTQESGHVERHARRRYQREWELPKEPAVRVIALRKTAVEVVEHEAEGKRHLTVRFVVRGHARLQSCGPGRVDRKLIWVDSYPKGPADAPFKESGQTVFAVIR